MRSNNIKDMNGNDNAMKPCDRASVAVTSMVGAWQPAADHLRGLGWTVENWEEWVNECQCGTLMQPEHGLVRVFHAHADDIGLAQHLRGNGDDVATCLACIWLWISLDEMLPEGENSTLDQFIERLGAAQ